MKTISLFLLLALSTASLLSAEVKDPALRKYVTRSFPDCPDSRVAIESVNQPGPAGFVMYRITQTSSDSRCGKATFALVSPGSGQILVADLFPLAADGRPAESRVNEVSQRILQTAVYVTIDPKPLTDGLRRVRISRKTSQGPFIYGAYIDSASRFLMIGRLGHRDRDPGKVLLDSIGIDKAVTRGSKEAKVRIVELSDFQCPTCRRAHAMLEPIIKKNLGKISYARIDLPIFEHHDWAFQAALGAHAIQKVAPAKYWTYVDYIFENQDLIKLTTIDSVVKDFAEMRDLDWKRIEPFYKSPQQKQQLLEQIGKIYDVGVFATPTFIINGQVIHYGNEGAHVKKAIEGAIAKVRK